MGYHNQLTSIPKASGWSQEQLAHRLCVSGSRSNVSIQILKDMGYTHLINGINAEQVQKKYL